MVRFLSRDIELCESPVVQRSSMRDSGSRDPGSNPGGAIWIRKQLQNKTPWWLRPYQN